MIAVYSQPATFNRFPLHILNVIINIVKTLFRDGKYFKNGKPYFKISTKLTLFCDELANCCTNRLLILVQSVAVNPPFRWSTLKFRINLGI